MLTRTRNTKECEIERTTHLSIWSGVIRATITEVKQLKTKTATTTTTYLLRPLASQIGGKGVEVEKLGTDGEVYHVLLNGPHGHECSCPHGTYRGQRTHCRHVEAALEAQKQGMI
jgi:hypothetical protein